MNLRGAVLPVIDLARRLGLAASGAGPGAGPAPGSTLGPDRKVVIVAMLGERVFGLMVDAVSDILSVPEDAMRPVPAIGDVADAGLVKGIAAFGGRMIRLLDLERVLGLETGSAQADGGEGQPAQAAKGRFA
ncbi:chemotaxis protein CheW [Amaricoccus sp.]|uniref:chemotaxis protein CheW n=1 Tax=Amaricoccus sp. TaxID=1872485 RepID=UPI0039E2AAF8